MVVNDPSIRPIFVSFIWNWGSLGLLDSHTCSWVWARSANGTAWRRTRKLRSCSSAAHFLGWIHGSKFPPLTIKHKEKRLKLDFQFVGGTSRFYVLYLSLSLSLSLYIFIYIYRYRYTYTLTCVCNVHIVRTYIFTGSPFHSLPLIFPAPKSPKIPPISTWGHPPRPRQDTGPRTLTETLIYRGPRIVTGFHLGVSKNSGFSPPNHPLLIGLSVINHPFWGTPIFGNTHLFLIIWAT